MSTAHFDRFTIDLPDECVTDCSRPGPNDEAVYHWWNVLGLDLPPYDVRAELREYGAWDEDQMDDEAENERRLLWIAAHRLAEERDQ